MTAGGNSFKNATAHKVNSYYTLAICYCWKTHYFRPCFARPPVFMSVHLFRIGS